MRYATWSHIEQSPRLLDVYRQWRRLPSFVRAPFRVLLLPHWYMARFLVRAASHDRVVCGPFTGMKLKLSDLSSRHLLGYILGSQELELREVINRIVERRYERIVNVGAADGYYAVGLARCIPKVHVEAFEALPELHRTIVTSARLNGVSERVDIHGTCDAEALRQKLADSEESRLVVMDIEGGEIDLLHPDAVPELCDVDILVETHDAFVPRVTETLIDRFFSTHNVECYTAQPRIVDDFPPNFLPRFRRWFPRLAVDLMDERRTGVQRWLYLTTKASPKFQGSSPDRVKDAR